MRQLVDFAGMTAADAERKAAGDVVVREGHEVLAVAAGRTEVGSVWLSAGPRWLYLFEVRVDPAERGRGHGRAAMAAVEDVARERGLAGLELNVWAGNGVARGLYRSLGYEERAIFMNKRVS